MSVYEVLTVSAIGGAAGALALAAFVALAVGLHTAIDRLTDIRTARQERRNDLNTCKATDALTATDHPNQ